MEPLMPEDKDIQIILVRMEGKLDRMGDRMERYERDLTGIRGRLHDVSNELHTITLLDLPARIIVADKTNADHDARLNALENIEQQRKGAAALVKVVWGIAGAIGVSGVAAIVRLIQVGGI